MMFKKYFIGFLFLLCISCDDNKKYTSAENALDAGREFIDGCLKGDFDKAAFYLLHNSTNDAIFSKLKEEYQQKSSAEKKQLKDASITILNVEEVSTDETIISYSNSFNNTTRVLKVIHSNNNWLVDVNYTVKGNL
ncbi:MAG: hypothetical protein C0459_12095 [Chitinophaga sp.]|jgi:hypothetical protein|nr:hypothetical protein [Chitinophaga sp.]